MPHLPLRRLLASGLVVAAACIALPSAGSARTHVYPDGPNCSQDASFQSLKSVTDAVNKGVPFSFVCVFYKDNSEVSYYDPATKGSDKNPAPYVPKLEATGTITVSSKVQHFLHLPSRVVASGDLTGPVTVTKGGDDTDIYRLHFKPSVAKILRAQRTGALTTDYDLTLKVVPGDAVQFGSSADTGNEGDAAPPTIKHVTTPGGTMHLANDAGSPLEIIENASAPCKHFLSGDGSSFGCAGGVH
jgi:hypothetical protein